MNRWWWPSLMMFGPPDDDSPNTEQSMAWKIKRHTNDELRQRFVDMTVPQAEALGVDAARPATCAGTPSAATTTSARSTGRSSSAVISGDGPCNAQRIANRRAAHESGAWVREAAAAYAAKQPPATARRRQAADAATRSGGARLTRRATWPLYEVFVRGKRGLNHVHVGSLHAADDADGAASRARPLHPAQRGREHLGGAHPTTSPRPARTRRTRSSRRAATRSTGIRRSTTSPTTCRTCDGHDGLVRRTPTRRLTDGTDDPRWAFGTGFDDPLAGVDTPSRTASTAPTSRRTA